MDPRCEHYAFLLGVISKILHESHAKIGMIPYGLSKPLWVSFIKRCEFLFKCLLKQFLDFTFWLIRLFQQFTTLLVLLFELLFKSRLQATLQRKLFLVPQVAFHIFRQRQKWYGHITECIAQKLRAHNRRVLC